MAIKATCFHGHVHWLSEQDADKGCATCEAIKAERLETERLREALWKITDFVDSEADDPLDDAIRIARKALNFPTD